MQRRLTNSNFLTFAQLVAAPSDPTEYNPAAVKRLMQYLSPYIIDVKGIRFKHHAKNKIELISFSTPQEQQAYANAWENYMKSVAMLEGGDMPGGKFMILVQFLKFRQAAELIRAPYLARRLYDIVYHKGKSAVCAVNFRETISKITSILVNDYGVSRDEISLIWGGQAAKAAKKKGKSIDKNRMEEMKTLFTEEDLKFLREMGAIDEEDNDTNNLSLDNDAKEADKAKQDMRTKLRLGTQSKQQRQLEIDRFQNDVSKFCIFTFKSGGVGLSLHQELPTRRQRETLVSPTYSAIELVQGLGRTARFTSCSDTEQTVVFYAGTIEVRVAARVSKKLMCLREVVRQRETWESVIMGDNNNRSSDDIEIEAKITTDDKPRVIAIESEGEDSDDLLVGGADEEEDEDE